MSNCAVCPNIPHGLSSRTTTVMATIAAMTFATSGAAPTPLYHHYQEAFGLSPAMLTTVFAAYVLTLLLALLTVGSLSDYVGRRPAILAALAMNIVAMAMFAEVDSATALIAARAVQGYATGFATAALGAAILDNDEVRAPVINSITAFSGLALGSIGGGALVTYGPWPTQLVYELLLVLSVLEAVLLWQMPETAAARPGAWASLRPHVSVPPQARRALIAITPVTVASWALGGFYFSLMPSLVRVATGVSSPIVGGLVVGALTLSGVVSVLLTRRLPAKRTLTIGIGLLVLGVSITVSGVPAQSVTAMLTGTVVAGLGFGAAFTGALRTVLPLAATQQRAGLLAAFYVEGYLSFSLPAIATGLLIPFTGLPLAAEVYGGIVVVLALASLPATLRARGE